MVAFVLRQISEIFEAAEIEACRDFQPPPFLSGQRRNLVEQYYASLDFHSYADVRKIVSAFADVIELLEAAKSREADPNQIQQSINNLIRRMERDGFKYQGGHFVSASLRLTVVDVPSLIAVTEESIAEQVEKAHAKIEAGDHSGAISSAYTRGIPQGTAPADGYTIQQKRGGYSGAL